MTTLSPATFSATTSDPQTAEPAPIGKFTVGESLAYGFKAMYGGSRFISWLVFSLMALVVHLPALLLMIPYITASANVDAASLEAGFVNSDVPVWTWALYVLATVWAVYAQASVLRGIIEGVRTGVPSLKGLAFPVNASLGRVYIYTIVETVLAAIAAIPMIALSLLAMGSVSLLLVGALLTFILVLALSLYLAFARQAVIDSGLGVIDSIKYSAALVNKNIGATLGLIIVTGIIQLAASMLFFFPILLVLAPVTIAFVHAYRVAGHGEVYALN